MAAPDPPKLLVRVTPQKVAAELLGVPASTCTGIDPSKLTLLRAFRVARKAAQPDAKACDSALVATTTAFFGDLLVADLELVADRLVSIDPQVGRITRKTAATAHVHLNGSN